MGLTEETEFFEHPFTPKAPVKDVEGYASGGGPGGSFDADPGFVEQEGSSDPGFKPVPFESEGAGSKYSAKQE